MKFAALLLIVFASFGSGQLAAENYMSEQEFIQLAFTEATETNQPQQKTLWLDEQTQQKISDILYHPYPKIRLRYWSLNQQTVWFLDEIGKERPISFAISVKNQSVQQIKVLAFRESRGGEIKMQAFTDQFNQLGLTEDGKLERTIDGITGATMSVTAMKKVARLAIMLANLVEP